MSIPPPYCELIAKSSKYPEKAVRHFEYSFDDFNIFIQGPGFSYACVRFKKPIGIRILDERDLCEFWEKYNEKNGWLYEIKKGGWLDLEKERSAFCSPSVFPNIKEYFVVDEQCFNILCTEEPEIIELGSGPEESV